MRKVSVLAVAMAISTLGGGAWGQALVPVFEKDMKQVVGHCQDAIAKDTNHNRQVQCAILAMQMAQPTTFNLNQYEYMNTQCEIANNGCDSHAQEICRRLGFWTLVTRDLDKIANANNKRTVQSVTCRHPKLSN